MSKRITIYFGDDEYEEVKQLSPVQMRILLVGGKKLFALLKETPESKEMLKYQEKLREAVETW